MDAEKTGLKIVDRGRIRFFNGTRASCPAWGTLGDRRHPYLLEDLRLGGSLEALASENISCPGLVLLYQCFTIEET